MIKSVGLKSLLSTIIDNRGKTCPTAKSGIPLIATNCVKNETLFPSYDKIRFVSQETYESWFRGHPLPGDIVFVVKGSPGNACMAPDPVDFCIAQDMVALRADITKVYPKYLFAVIRSDLIQNAIRNMHVGTLIPHFKKGDFDKLFLPIPDMESQEFIGDLYYMFSYKIELNHRMNETLEAMAQALFKSWFVDFDPVIDKALAAGNPIPEELSEKAERRKKLGDKRKPLLEDIADLFPDEFENSELGWIPKGWEVESLDKIAEYLNGIACQKYPPKGDNYLPVIKIRELRQGFTENTDRVSREIPTDYIIQDGDVLFSWSGSLLVKLWCNGVGVLNQHLFKISSNEFPKWFYYHWTQEHLKDFQRIAAGKATTMGHIKRRHLTEAKVLIPKRELLNAMSKYFTLFIEKHIATEIESRNLICIRDTLLPKLISGKLRVPDSIRIGEEFKG